MIVEHNAEWGLKILTRPPRSTTTRSLWEKSILPSLSSYPHLKKYEFFNINDRFANKVYVTLFIPKKLDKSKPIVIFSHGNGCDLSYGITAHMEMFLPKGIAVLQFTFPGCMDTEPDFITFGAREHQTLIDVISFVQSKGFDKIGLWGHSMGGFATLLAVENLLKANVSQKIKAIVLDNAFGCMKEQAMHWFGDNEQLFNDVCKMAIDKYGFDPNEVNGYPKASEIYIPTLIYHCKSDKVVPEQFSQQIAEEIGPNAERFTTDIGTHTLREPDVDDRISDFFYSKLISG